MESLYLYLFKDKYITNIFAIDTKRIRECVFKCQKMSMHRGSELNS